jgi:hypothetical protein
MSRRGENIFKRQDGRWEARYIKAHDENGRAVYGYIYRHSYLEAKKAQAEAKTACGNQKAMKGKAAFSSNHAWGTHESLAELHSNER